MDNKKLIKAALLVSVLLLNTSCSQKDPDLFHQEAIKFISDGDNTSAILALKNAIQLAPNSPKHRQLLASTYFNVNDFASAEKEIQKAWDLGKENDNNFLLLIRALHLQDKHEDLLLTARTYEPETDAVKSESILYEIIGSLEIGSINEAKQLIEEFTDLSDVDNNKIIALAYIDATEGKIQQALDSLEKSTDIKNHEKSLLAGRLAFLSGDYIGSANYFEEYLSNYANNYRANIYYTNALIYQRDYARAETALENVKAVNPKHPITDHLKAEIAFAKGDFEASKELVEIAIGKGLDSRRTELILAVSSFKTGAYETAHNVLEKLPESSKSSAAIKQVEVLTKIKLGYDFKVDESQAENFSTVFNESLSIELAKNNYFEQAKILGQRVIDSYESEDGKGDTSSSDVKKAFFQISFGDKEEGTKELLDVLLRDPSDIDASILLAQAQLSEGNYNDAVTTTSNALKLFPENPYLLSIGGKSYESAQDFENAKRLFLKVQAQLPEHKGALLYFVRDALRENDGEKARELLKEYIKQYSVDEQLETILFRINASLGYNAENITYFKTRFESDKSANTAALYAAALFQQKDYNQVVGLLTQEMGGELLNEANYRALAESYLALNKHQKALETYEEWMKSRVKSPLAFLSAINLYDFVGDIDNANDTVKEAVSRYPNNIEFALLNTLFTLKAGNLELAENLINNLDMESSQQHVLGLIGMLQSRKEQYKLAYPALKLYYEQYPSQNNMSELIQASMGLQGAEKTIELLETMSLNRSEDTVVLKYYADSMIARDIDKAINAFERLLDKGVNDSVTLNNLAWLYYIQGRHQKALPLAEKAISSSPETMGIIETLGSIYVKLADYEKAYPLLKKIYQSDQNKSLDFYFNYAESLIKTGREGEAQALLNNLSLPEEKTDIIGRRNELLSQAGNK